MSDPAPAPNIAPPPEPHLAAVRRLTWVVFLLAAAPAVVAIWTVPGFVTQDGPAHLYNAHIIRDALTLGHKSPFHGYFHVRWWPMPNWGGHLMLVALMSVVPPLTADRILMTLSFVGFSASILWLRWVLRGWQGMPVAALLAVALGLNMPWLMGFYSFLLGACLFAVTLGIWWAGHDRQRPRGAALIGGLLIVGYFFHLVSMGLTAVGMIVLATTTPGLRRLRRWGWTMGALLPLIPLGMLYRTSMREGGEVSPVWTHISSLFSLRSWGQQIGWVDPISLASKQILPFMQVHSRWCGALTPVVWVSLALALFGMATVRSPGEQVHPNHRADLRRGWAVLSVLLLAGGLFGPDTIGAGHGNYLPQRVFLLGLAAIVPYLELSWRSWLVRLGTLALVVALAVQSAFVWQYAQESRRLVQPFLAAKAELGQRERIGTLLIDIRGRFRSNPLRHADCLVGVGNGNIIWANYETKHYYFPVQVVNASDHPPAGEFEDIALMDDPPDAAERSERWERLIERYHGEMEAVIIWGFDPDLDAITARWFREGKRIGRLRIMRHIPGTQPEPSVRPPGVSQRAGRATTSAA